MNKKARFLLVAIMVLWLFSLFASLSVTRADFQVIKLTSTLNFMGNDVDSNGVLWAGDKNFSIWKSTDKGASFQFVYTLPHDAPRPDNPYSGLVWTVFVDSRNYVFASGGGANNSLYRSTNGGASFTAVLNANDTTNRSFFVFMTEDNSGNLYTATYTIGTTIQPQIYKSTNGGTSWIKIGNFSVFHFHNIKFNPNNGYLYVVTGERNGPLASFNDSEKIFRSKDLGATWNLIVDRNDALGTVYLAITFVGNYVYLGQDYPWRTCQIHRFLDEGQTTPITPQAVYTPPSDGCMPFISGTLFNGSLIFGSCAEMQNGTSRVVTSFDGLNWNILTSASIPFTEPRWNIFTVHPRSGIIFATLKNGYSYQISDVQPIPPPTPQPTDPSTPEPTVTYTQSPVTAPTPQATAKPLTHKPTPIPTPSPTATPTSTPEPTTKPTEQSSTPQLNGSKTSNNIFVQIAIAATVVIAGTILSVTLLKKRGVKRLSIKKEEEI